MLLRPSVLPDEFDRGYLGRVMRLNHFEEKKPALMAIRVWAGEDPVASSGRRTGTIKLLSDLSEKPLDAFIAEHSTLPWRRAITPYKTDLEHGGEESESLVTISAFRLAREHAYFCPECVAEDQERLGFSYWRRSHQIPSVYTCGKHQAVLHKVEDPWAFLEPPSACMPGTVPDSKLVNASRGSRFVERFLAIGCSLMARTLPVSTYPIMRALRRKGLELGLQVAASSTAKQPLLSDLVVTSFPDHWLKEVFPAIGGKRAGEAFSQLDGVFYFANSASSVEAYFLAFSVLFGSAQAALEAISAEENKPLHQRSKREKKIAPERSELIAAYIETKGCYSGTARRCGTSPFVVRAQLEPLGLPGIKLRGSASVLVAARAFYLEKRGLLEAAAQGGVSVSELETLVRSASPSFVTALSAITAIHEDALQAA